jgi:hypothetical protein
LYGSTTVSETLGDGTTLNVIIIPKNDYINIFDGDDVETYDQDILHESSRWVKYPYQIRYHHQVNELIENLEGNRMILLPCGRHPKLNRQVPHLLYNDLWPNCYRHQIDLHSNKYNDKKDSWRWVFNLSHITVVEKYIPKTKLSGRKSWPNGPLRTESMVPGSRSTRTARGTYFPPKIKYRIKHMVPIFINYLPAASL